MSAFTEAFLEACAGKKEEARSSKLEDELDAALERAHAAWPDIALADEAFARELAARLPIGDAPLDALRRTHVDDVYFAVACAAGNATALAEVERRYIPEVRRALAAMGLSWIAEEALQMMREDVLVGKAGVPPRIATYAGRGDLRGWFRAVAGRAALHLARKHRGQEASAGQAEAVALENDVELAYLKQTYGAAFQTAFREALESLTQKERVLLKQRVRHHLSLDEIAAMNGVHASTVSRWLASARERLVAETRDRMMVRLKVGRAEAESILRLIQSQLDLSLSVDADADRLAT